MSNDLKHAEEATLAARTSGRRSDQPYTGFLDEEEDTGAAATRRAPRISREDVFAAADALLVEGARPTIDRVRMRLGRGSPNTINDHLDIWWAKLGARLRDLPGGEFPTLPEEVGQRLIQLWNEALAAAHESLQSTLSRRSDELVQREQQLAAKEAAVQNEAHASATRAMALEEALQLMRGQLEEANQRARSIEEMLNNRDGDILKLRSELEQLQKEYTQLLAYQERERAAASTERARMESRQEAIEARWLGEVDRARQATKAVEGHARDLQVRLDAAQKERDSLRSEAQDLRGKLAMASAVREQLVARLNTYNTVRRPNDPPVRAAAKRRARAKRPVQG